MNSVAIDSKRLVQEYMDAISGKPKTAELLDQYISDDILKEHIGACEAAFPEYEMVPSLMIAEGDVVAARCIFRGTHKGQFGGVRPTGRNVSTGVIIIYRVSEGRIAEHWLELNTVGLMEQLTR